MISLYQKYEKSFHTRIDSNNWQRLNGDNHNLSWISCIRKLVHLGSYWWLAQNQAQNPDAPARWEERVGQFYRVVGTVWLKLQPWGVEPNLWEMVIYNCETWDLHGKQVHWEPADVTQDKDWWCVSLEGHAAKGNVAQQICTWSSRMTRETLGMFNRGWTVPILALQLQLNWLTS